MVRLSRRRLRWVTLEPNEVQWMLAHGRISRMRLIIPDTTRRKIYERRPVVCSADAWDRDNNPDALIVECSLPNEAIEVGLDLETDEVHFEYVRYLPTFDADGVLETLDQEFVPYPFGKPGELQMVKERFDIQDGQVVFPAAGGRQARRMPRSAARYWVKLIRSEIVPLEISNLTAHGLDNPIHGIQELMRYNFKRNFQDRAYGVKDTAVLWKGVYALIRKKT